MNNAKGQSLLELVIGLSLISVVIGAIAIITTYSLRNAQFSKNQAQATKLAQENLEKIKAIRAASYGICYSGVANNSCVGWDNIWGHDFTILGGTTGEKYKINTCTLSGQTQSKPYCMEYDTSSSPAPVAGNANFSSEIRILNEGAYDSGQKKVISRVYWTDNSGSHQSDLVTILSRY